MKKSSITLFSILILFLVSVMPAGAAQLKAYVAEFTVTGATNKEELKPALQTLLKSRLPSEHIDVVEAAAAAEITVTGSYIAFGKVFSLDAVARNREGKVVARSFIQGDSQEELIPAIAKLARSLADEVAKSYSLSGVPSQLPAAVVPQPAPASAEIVRPQSANAGGSAWISQRLPGALSSMALGRNLNEGQEVFLAGSRSLRYYVRGKELQLLSEISLDAGKKVLGIDTADIDKDGVPEIYVTVASGSTITSEVYAPVNSKLRKVADDLPYFLRGIGLSGNEKKIYAQQLNMDTDFYGDVLELSKKGAGYTAGNPLKLPKGANIFNFNTFRDAAGKNLFIFLNSDGYLVICSQEGEELWRSSDKFGGSEVFFERATSSEKTGAFSRHIFLDQRIVGTKNGEILIPQNAGFWVLGNSRSYSKYSVYSFSWNGSSLEEKWHTKQSQNYLADFAHNPETKELYLLEVVQKEGMLDKGASALAVKKVE